MAEELKRKIFEVNILIFLFYIFYIYGSDRFWLHFLTKGSQVQKKLSYAAHVLKASVMNPSKDNRYKNDYMQAKANFK